MEYLTNEDLSFLSQQSQNKMNMIVFGMTALMDETNDRVHQLESQTWFQRMSNTITGKNKMTVNEIANNRDKINVYLSEAISCLYDQNKINENIILGLGNRLNELYAQQIEIKQMIGAFVTKLNQKIISIDNFHMLTEEINQGVYSAQTPIVSICRIVSQLDARTIHDSRKMEILLRAMEQNGLLSDEEVLFSTFLQELLTVSESDSGVIAMMFENAKEDYMTEIALQTVCQYYLLPDKVRKMKSKKAVVESVLRSNEIDLECEISTKEYYESLIECLTNNILMAEAQDEELENKSKYEKVENYFDEALEFVEFINDMVSSWNINSNELHTAEIRNDYSELVSEVKKFCSGSTLSGTQFFATLNNLESFIQASCRLIGKNIVKTKFDHALNNVSKDERGCIFCDENGIITSDGNYYSLSKYVNENITSRAIEAFKNYDQLLESKKYDLIGLSLIFTITAPFLSYSFKFLLESCLKPCIDECVENNSEKINDFFALTEQYPIIFDVDENWDLIRSEVVILDPYISFEYKDRWVEHDDANHTSFDMGNSLNELTVVIHFNNMEKLGTIHYSILENAAHNWSFVEQNKFKVSWGNWVGSHACELNFKQLTTDFGSIKVKVWADCNPDCEGIIEGH